MLEDKSQASLSLRNKGDLYPVQMTFKDRLKRARKAVDCTQQEVADALDVSPHAVSGWERGEAMPEPDKLPLLAKRLGRSVDWLLDGREPARDLSSEDVAASIGKPPRRMIRVKGYVGAGGQAHYYAVDPGDLGEIEGGGRATDQTVALVIIGASLGKFFDHWHVLYDDVRSPVTEDLIGELCVAGLADDRVLVKKIQRNGRGFDLLSNAESEPPIKNVKIEWAAKVTDLRRG